MCVLRNRELAVCIFFLFFFTPWCLTTAWSAVNWAWMQRALTISWVAASSSPLFSAKISFAQILFLATKFISEKIPPDISWKCLLHRKLQRESAESRQRALVCQNFSTSVGRDLTIEPVIFPPALVFASPIQVLAVDKASRSGPETRLLLRCDPILLQTMERLLCLLFLSSLILQEAVGKFLHRTHRSDQISEDASITSTSTSMAIHRHRPLDLTFYGYLYGWNMHIGQNRKE